MNTLASAPNWGWPMLDLSADTSNELLCDLRYETASGVHTYHAGDCCGRPTRRGVCSTCLFDELERRGVDVRLWYTKDSSGAVTRKEPADA